MNMGREKKRAASRKRLLRAENKLRVDGGAGGRERAR